MPVSEADKLQGHPKPENSSVLDFWRWAFSDLSDDDIKGLFAEWLVHKLLGIQSIRRVSWANSDVITPRGTRIEVKSTAYWQSWKYLGEDGLPLAKPRHQPHNDDGKIRFGGLKARDSTNAVTEGVDRDFKSDFYVFALQKETNLDSWNALNLSQWEFFWVPISKLRELGSASISLRTLRKNFGTLSAEQLSVYGRDAIITFEAGRDA